MGNRLLAGLVLIAIIVQLHGVYKDYADENGWDAVRKAPANLTFDLKGHEVKGGTGARVALIEFSDYECPFCAMYAATTGKEVDKEFVNTGKIRVAFVNNPLPIHTDARLLAKVAICAGRQGKYWAMHDALFTRPTEQAVDDIRSFVLRVNVSPDDLQRCINEKQDPPEIDADIAIAKRWGINGTPYFGIGTFITSDTVRVMSTISGASPLAAFQRAINAALAAARAPRKP